MMSNFNSQKNYACSNTSFGSNYFHGLNPYNNNIIPFRFYGLNYLNNNLQNSVYQNYFIPMNYNIQYKYPPVNAPFNNDKNINKNNDEINIKIEEMNKTIKILNDNIIYLQKNHDLLNEKIKNMEK